MALLLLAEDDVMIKRMLTLRLQMMGHDVESVENGQLAVEAAISQRYDLVLMDMHMPTMDGYTATRTLRERGYQKTIVAVTASAMSEDSEKAVKAGCDYHIAKPIGEDFEQLISDILSRES